MGFMDKWRARRAEKHARKYFSSLSHSLSERLNTGKQTSEKWEKQFFWYEGIIKRDQLRSKETMETLRTIRDINPDASMAIWNFLRLSNQGHELECLKHTGSNDKQGLEYLNSIAKKVGALYGGGADQLINVLNLTAYTQGAIALEVELNEGLNGVVDFHAVDPSTLDFRKDKDTGEIQLVQKQSDGIYKILNREQVFYQPLDPDIGDPYGRSPILPVLQIIFFQVEVLKDLKAVAHNQGHSRLDIAIAEEMIMKNIPQDIKAKGAQAMIEFANTFIKSIENQFKSLKPDDNLFHPDFIKVDMVGGTSGKSMDITKLIDVINQQVVTSLKQLPILLGRNEGSTETHGTVQWQIHVAGIESIQRGVKRVMERAYNLALQIQGKQSRARLTFNKLRTTDRFKEAQAEEIETRTKVVQIQQGWIDHNEAANEMVGHDAVAEPQPVPGSTLPTGRERVESPKGKKSRADETEDDFVSEIDSVWAEDISRLTVEAKDGIYHLLESQKQTYIERIEDAGVPPTRFLIEAESHRSQNTREGKNEPSEAFAEWVKVNVLTDSGEQMEIWDEEGFDWIEQAAKIAGESTLLDLEVDKEFDIQDENLLKWLSERSRRFAELIQGVTDEDVIMSLWDVVYEGKYTIDKAAKSIEESYGFSKDRAQTIARTEIISAARSGQFHADDQSGIVIGKEWFSAHQSNTRPGHREADGQVRPLREPFHVKNRRGTYEELHFPGDSSLGASADNVIQCRCGYFRILEGEEDKLKGWNEQ